MNRAIRWQPFSVVIVLVSAMVLALPALAHHGWGWAMDEITEITGEVVDVRLGNPHGEVTLDVDGDTWVVEVGQPWRNERAGLTSELLSTGRVITAVGNRSAKEGERLLKAVRIVIDGKNHDLYEGRIP